MAASGPGITDIKLLFARSGNRCAFPKCPTHHTVIDDDEEAYTVERLCKIKAAHEAQSAPIPNAEAAAVAEVFIQSATNIGQSGGLSAHTVNASTITVQSAPSTSHLTRQRQIQAVEHLWQVVRNLSSEFSLVAFVDTILTPSELDACDRRTPDRHRLFGEPVSCRSWYEQASRVAGKLIFPLDR